MVDRKSDRIQQSCAAAHIVLFLRHALHPADRCPVVEDLPSVVKKDSRDICFSFFLFLFLHHAVEAADRVGLQPMHGTASVQNKYKLSQSFFHLTASCFFRICLIRMIPGYMSRFCSDLPVLCFDE